MSFEDPEVNALALEFIRRVKEEMGLTMDLRPGTIMELDLNGMRCRAVVATYCYNAPRMSGNFNADYGSIQLDLRLIEMEEIKDAPQREVPRMRQISFEE